MRCARPCDKPTGRLGSGGDPAGCTRVAAVDLCHEECEQFKRAILFEAEKPPNVAATRRVPNEWHCRRKGGE